MGIEDSLRSNLIENVVCRIGEGFDQNIRLLQIYKYNRSKAKAGSVRFTASSHDQGEQQAGAGTRRRPK